MEKNKLSKMITFCLALASAWLSLSTVAAENKIQVVCTVGMVADLAKHVGGEWVEVQALMGPGVDPHLYKATASDITRLEKADVIFYNGLLLEGKMADLFSKLARKKRFVYPVAESIPETELLEPAQFQGHYDPHVWFDVRMWAKCIDTVQKGLGEFAPQHKGAFDKNAHGYRKKLTALHDWALAKANELPKERRILVTSHDAYNYFGRAYGFQVVGLQGVSTVTEAGSADMVKLVDFIKQHKVKAIFVESSVSHATIERISKDAGVRIGGELFSDAMGAAGDIENGYDKGTYEGMIKHNLTTIVEALK